MYISYIAILKAGLAFCPIAHDTPKERLQALFEDLQPITVLVAGSAPSAASAMSAKPLLDTTPYLRACDVSTSCSLEKGTPTIPSTSTAYVLYTSGTTGRAKGVAISHASAACTISALSSHYGFGQLLGPTNTQQLRWFQGAAPTFDISIFEIFWTLSTGSTLCCAPRDFTLQNLDKVLTTLKADITNITPSFASLLDPSSIKGLMLGGESLTTRIIQDFAPYNAAAISRSVGKPSGLYNGYGPTEAAIYCIAQAHVPSGQRGSVIGTPLSTCGVLIVDEGYTEAASTLTLRPVPMGATGELVLIGPQISQTGYINRESETAAAFFDDDTWGRGYKSGDRARIVWDDRGNPIIEFLGRISDDQVKLSGRRVELAEIESILTEKVPQIRETLSVVWRPQGSVSGSEKVVSLIVLDPDSRDDFGSVERDCMRVAHQYLPDYMRPFRLLNVEELPKSSSGKKNRAKAAEHVQVHLEQHNYPTSRDVDIGRLSPLSNEGDAKLEDELLEMVSNILGTNQTINATTLLASTGLDSLLAMRFLRDIRHRWSRSDLGQEYPRYSQLQPSLAQLLGADASIRSVFFSAFAEGKREQARLRVAEFSRKNMPEALSKLNVTPRDVEAILPATNTQSQLAVSFAMDARNYISHSILRLRAGTCVPALMHSIESVISLQPIYRSMMIPCGDSFSPFAQVVVTQDAWSQITEASPRITHQKVCAQYLDSGIDDLVENAAAKMNLESNILYQIQVIEEDQDIASPVVLILSFAHCICDGASIQLLLLDIASCFSGQTLPQRNSIFDSVVDWASGLDPATDRMWQDELVGQEAESLGSLSGNNAEFGQSKEKKDFGMVQHQSELSWAYLESRSRILNSSPLSIVQAAWCVLISLLSEADTLDVTFGSVLSGHHTPTHAPDFSVVPCRVALPSSQTVQELLEALNAKSRVAQTKRHTSFGVLRALPYNTALALQAYTDSDEKREPEVASFPWTEARSRAIRYDFAIFAEVIPPSGGLPGSPEYFGDGMTFKITYHEDTLSKVSAGFVARQLAGLVDVFLGADPYDLVQALPSRLPRHLLSVEGNATDQSHSAESHATLLHSQFESQAAATPDRVALTFYTSLDTPPTDVSYRELDSRANGLANILRQENAEVIPICIQRSVDLYVAILAILKAGSAWCPIDDTSPIQRRTSLIARTQSNVLLTNKESLHLVEPCLSQESLHGWRVIIMDEYANHELLVRPNPRTGTLSPGSICGTDLAYLLWTSGTTGEPKGVMIPHSAAFQAMKDLQIQVAHDDKAGQVRTLQLSSYTFDVFVQDLFYTWGLAGCVVSGTRELILGTFVDFIWKARPTHAHLTPSFGASIAVEEIRGSTLQYVTFIGEKLTEDVAHAWAAPDITTAAYNTYGPAENAVVSTMRQFRGKTREPAKAANVGFPLNSCTAFVVREVEMAHGQQKRWELVPRYGVGELALGGLQVGKGYLANKTKTTKSFITNANAIDGRIYLTGDMVRLNDHGFEFLGRNDDLVKITGIRIELSEISAACATVKSEEAAIEHVETLYLPLHGSDAESKSKVVVTFVSIKTSDIDTDSIRSQVIQRAKDLLPAYMVPGHVIILDGSMPRTASNKVDRKVLREIYQSSDLKLSARGVLADPSGGVDASKTEHWSEEELPIVDMITAYLEIPPERNSPDNTLAALGLSSLQITKLAWYLKRELECPINVLSLMRCQILGELINVVTDAVRPRCEATPETMIAESDNTRADHSWLANIREDLTNKLEGSMRPQDTLCVLPATPMQESLLVETMLDGGAYWTHRVFDLSHMEQIDAQRLEAAWEKCTQRFDILRSVFFPLTLFDIEGSDSSISWARAHGISSTILQFVRSNAKVYWTTCSQGDLGGHARKLQTELQPSKTNRPPWAVTYTESEHKLMLSMHHALYDGVSSQILLETVTALYRDSNHLSPDCTLQFERGLELGLLPTIEQREEAASLWAAQLMELQQAVGPTNGPFPDLTQSRQKQSREILCARAAVPAIFKSRDTAYPSVPIAFQSAFGCILAWYMELDAVILGQTVSQRIIHPDLERVMGPAIATIPVVIRASSSSASELWENMSRDSAKYSHVLRHLHPVDLKRAFKKANNGTNLPLPGIFVYHPAPHSDIEQPTSLALQMFKEQDMALSLNVEHPLALNIFEAEKTIELTGDGRQISQGQLDLMLQQTLEVMHAMVDSPDTALCQLRNRFARNLVSVSGKTLSASPQQVDPSDTVAIHASNSPDWIAAEELVFEESDALDDTILTRQITYGQLNTLTNAIATKLTTHAAQLHTDDVVAMYMARDIMSLAVTLAIFRAGFVYLPIDEDLPLARKQLIIRDAKAKLVITTADLENTLGLDRNDDPPVFLVPDGNDAIDTVSSWPRSWTREPIINGGYLLYTSGSSGRPKGVRVSAQNLCSFIEAFSTRLVEHAPATATLGNSGKYLNLTSRAFDPHLTQMFVPWYLGYRVVIGKDRNSMLASLHQVIKHSEITHFGSVPSVLTKMGLKHSDVPTVRVITTGGEQASSELLDMWSSPAGPTAADDHGRATLFNFYGPTEVTIGCLGHAVNHNSNSRNLGLPLHGLEALLICHTSEGDAVLAMRGQPGELCIAGPQVAIGYLDRPDETAKSFCTIHLPNWGEKRVYRTGDMMRMMHDGTLEFLGRIDQQTKVRGQRLELGEVVTFLKESSVGEGHLDFAAAVVSNPNANNQQVLMGFVARDARDLLRRELEADSQVVHNLPQAQQDLFNVIGQKCDEKLPAFMVPTLVWVSKIPYLAASGKVDAKQLKRLGNDFFGGQTHTIHQYHCDAPQGSMPFVPSEMVQRWVGSDRKLFDSLLSINIIDNDVAVTPENKPGGMAALHTESKSDMALAIDVDIYTDGSIDLTLSSCGVLSSSRLADTAQIFEKIVCSAATAGATVGQFVPVYHHTSTLARISDPKAEGSKSTLSDRGQLSATDSVHIALSRFLQLPKPEISTKPGTTTLYQLGLDSITVLPFVKCLSGETGLKLTVDAVIKSRTVQGLIDHVHGSEAKLGKRLTSTELEAVESVHKPSQKEDTVSDSYDNILAELAKDLFFLATPMQEGMLSASFAITKSAYLYSHSIQLSGKALEMDTPSLDAFSAAVQDVIQACEILRTQFTFTQNSQAPWLARDGPVFDEYPLIANFFISGNTLYGKLRGNLGSSELKALGRAVEAMLMRIAVGDAHEPVIDLAKMKITTRHDSKKNGALSSKTDRVGELNGHTPHCDAVLDIVKAILGPRSKGRALDYYTKLANAGIDSILAIKLANAVRKKTGLIVSVFQIMKGASVRDIVENGTRDQREEPHASTQKSQSQAKEQEMKSLVAEKLQSSEDLILSVLPVLSGQRAHLEQWLLHGKRFFEAPWLYRVLDDNIDKEMVARRWSELVRAHDILRTTFAVVGKDADLVQVTLSEADNGSSRFTVIHDDGKLIEELVTQHISKENADPSNMRKPPSRLSFLEGSDGKAVVLRFHHALYDAWSIKMIESDLINMLTHGTALQHHGSLELQVQQIRGARDLAMENSYWRQHLLRAQDTILLPAEDSQLAVQVSHGPHFKVKSSVGIPREAVDCLASTKNPSAVILFAFAKTLSRFTGRSHPTFGLSHASRVLCSTTGAQDIDLTAANMPTLTVTPMSVDLERGANAPASALTSIQHHLAQLAKFSQTGNVRKMGPRFNTHINIMFVDSDQAVQVEERPNKTKALSRWRLGEPIASDYFTISKPSTLSASLVDQLDISHLYPHQLFFNITVQDQQSISVSLSGDRSLLAGSMMSAEAFIACFTTQLEESTQQAFE
ncbi:nonribosomal peptide synthase [Cordyceps javanica]|uniref:Nonribosomal peptide synthase n=1 Tax=Cordyceps javanica TaxID=43265 RepID=A0A545UXE7_9HYPO|nr:nonribosomal peptide synthase [Cordyceps javanica]